MNQVKFKNSLAVHDFIYSTLIKKLTLKIKEIENFEELRLNPELTRFILSCIHEEVKLIGKTWSKKIDIKAILTEIIKNAFNLNNDEVSQLQTQIDFILDNYLIKKKGLLTSFIDCVSSSIIPSSLTTSTLPNTYTPLKTT